MKLIGSLGLFLGVALQLAANPIDVTTATTAVLHTGDELVFTFSTYSFQVNAAKYGVFSTPTNVSFGFSTDAAASGGVFEASLESRDGLAAAEFPGTLTFSPGWFQGTYYQGAVAELNGSISLLSTLSQQLFSGSTAILTLKNEGPDIVLGLAPYTLSQDLTVSLYAGGLSCGGAAAQVLMNEETASAPEMDSRLLFACGGLLLLLVSQKLKRDSHGRV